jgi:iron complex transport system ATP-binding protein
VLLAAGRVVAQGPPSEVATAERLSSLYDAPVRVVRIPGSDAPFVVAERGAGPR